MPASRFFQSHGDSEDIPGKLDDPVWPCCYKERPLGQTYCSGLTWMPESSLSTRIGSFQSCSLLRKARLRLKQLFPQSSLITGRGKYRSLRKYHGLPETSPTRPQARRQAGEECSILMMHTEAAQCKQSLVLGMAEEDAAWCKVFREKRPPLAPRWARVGLHSSPSLQPLQRGTSYLVAWVHETLTAERIQVIHLNSGSFCPLKSSYQKPRDLLYQLQQRQGLK